MRTLAEERQALQKSLNELAKSARNMAAKRLADGDHTGATHTLKICQALDRRVRENCNLPPDLETAAYYKPASHDAGEDHQSIRIKSDQAKPGRSVSGALGDYDRF
jgi:hypothetical protein